MYRNCIFRSVALCVKSATLLQWHTTCPFSNFRSVIMKPCGIAEWTHIRLIHLYNYLNAENTLVTKDFFENIKDKSKETFLDMIHIFESKGVHRRGHVEFIYAALRHMEEFGVHKDLEVYKSLIDVLPKGKFIPTNIFQAEFQHYPKQQQCIIDLLDQMEENGKCEDCPVLMNRTGVMPDPDMENMLINIFGRRGHPVRKYWRMMYWMPKFKNISPWPLPNPVPSTSLELAKLALERMSSIDLQSEVSVYQTSDIKDSIDDTWIVSAQSPVQRELLDVHPHDVSIYVEGAFRIWLRNASVSYFILRADPRPKPRLPSQDLDDVGNLRVPFFEDSTENQALVRQPSVHEQEDGTIFAMCATGTSSRDSLLSWIRSLEINGNPALANVPVLFTSKSPLGAVVPINECDSAESTEHTNMKSVTEHNDKT